MSEYEGVVEHWDDQKGFGFISIAQGKKVFFHVTAVHGSHWPQQGEMVKFQLGNDNQGRPTATHVRSTNLALDNPRIRIKPTVTSVGSITARSGNAKQTYRLRESSIPWRYLMPLLILPGVGVADLIVNYQSPRGILIYVLVSALTYYFYWDDKRRAQRNEWRITEANLHFWSLAGGWPGAFIAQKQFRHKTKKLSFQLVFWFIVIAHQLLWFDWLFMDGRWLMSFLR